MARNRKIQILRGMRVNLPLEDGEFALQRSADGLDISLYIGTPFGNRLLGMDMNSEAYKEFITNLVVSEEWASILEDGFNIAGSGLQVGHDNKRVIRLGTPGTLSSESVNVTSGGESPSHTHNLQDGGIANRTLAAMSGGTFKGAQVAGPPMDLTIETVQEMLGISQYSLDISDAGRLTRGYLIPDIFAEKSIEEYVLSEEVQRKLNVYPFTYVEAEEDPFVADWARKPNDKPKYTYEEVGAPSLEIFNETIHRINTTLNDTLIMPDWDSVRYILTMRTIGGDSKTIEFPMARSITEIQYDNLLPGLKYLYGEASIIDIPIPGLGWPYHGEQSENIRITVTETNSRSFTIKADLTSVDNIALDLTTVITEI